MVINGGHGQMEKAPGICHDAITRVPHIWRWPGHCQAGHVAHEIVEAVDVSSTLCALAGLERMQTGDGQQMTHSGPIESLSDIRRDLSSVANDKCF